MNRLMLDDLQRRLGLLESHGVQHRAGVVTSVSPLAVALGGSTVSYTNVRAIAGLRLSVGDAVSVQTFGNDLIVQGAITATGGLICGTVSSTGTVLRGVGFTAARVNPPFAAGVYQVTFTAPFAAIPNIQVTPGAAGSSRRINVSASLFQVAHESSPGVLADTEFDFVAMPQ